MHAIVIVLIAVYIAYHLGFSHSTYKHRRTRKGHRVNLYWSTVRGPWISIKGPAGFRIGHKL